MEFTVWHGLFCFVLVFPGLRIEASPLSTVQGKCIYKIFKAENQETKFPLLCTKPSIDKHKFSFSKVGSPKADLSAIRGTIVESSGPICWPSVLFRPVFGQIYRPTAAIGLTADY